jgi:hypothetical protein
VSLIRQDEPINEDSLTTDSFGNTFVALASTECGMSAQMKVRRKKVLLATSSIAFAFGLVLTFPATAQASSYQNWYTAPSTGTPQDVWKEDITPGTYNGSRVATYQDPAASAFVKVVGVGGANAPETVLVTFASRAGIDTYCKWSWYGKNYKGILKCDLRY